MKDHKIKFEIRKRLGNKVKIIFPKKNFIIRFIEKISFKYNINLDE